MKRVKARSGKARERFFSADEIFPEPSGIRSPGMSSQGEEVDIQQNKEGCCHGKLQWDWKSGRGDESLNETGNDQDWDSSNQQLHRFCTGAGQGIAARKDPGKEQALGNPQARASSNEYRGQFQYPVRRDKAPELQAHAGKVAGDANHADKEAVEGHHVDRPKASRDAQRESRKADTHVVGHDGTRCHRLDAHDRVSPHLVTVDGFDHLRSEDLHLKVGILICENGPDQARNREDDGRQGAMAQVTPECNRISPRKERNHRHGIRSMAGIDGIVGPDQ